MGISVCLGKYVLAFLASALLVVPRSINITDGRTLTCWITFTKSLRALRLDRVMMTAVARYRRMWGHMVWIAFRYLQTQRPCV